LRARRPSAGFHQGKTMGRVDGSFFIGGAVRVKMRMRQDVKRGRMKVMIKREEALWG